MTPDPPPNTNLSEALISSEAILVIRVSSTLLSSDEQSCTNKNQPANGAPTHILQVAPEGSTVAGLVGHAVQVLHGL